MATAAEISRIKADLNKIKAVVLYILKVSGGKMSIPYLFGRMYFSQKRYLVRYGKPLFNDSFYADEMASTPAFVQVAFYCTAENIPFPYATDIFKRFSSSFTLKKENKWYVCANEEPDMDKLSEEEIRTIDTVLKKYERLTLKQLVNGMRDDAWKKALERKADDLKMGFLSFADMARAGGASEETIDYILRNHEINVFD